MGKIEIRRYKDGDEKEICDVVKISVLSEII